MSTISSRCMDDLQDLHDDNQCSVIRMSENIFSSRKGNHLMHDKEKSWGSSSLVVYKLHFFLWALRQEA